MFWYNYSTGEMEEGESPSGTSGYAAGQTPREALDNAQEWLLDRIESALWCDPDRVSQWRGFLKKLMEYSR